MSYEIIVYGATSFVGQILCQYLVDQYPNKEIKWAAAGRSQEKLDSVLKKVGADVPTIVADSSDEKALNDMVKQSKVIISTVGPYALYGSKLVKACTDNGTDYVDLTGEPQWIRRMISAHEEQAKKSGARIVHCCGFDSIPLDMGNHFLQSQAKKLYSEPATEVKMAVNKMKGGGSGGTIASGINLIKEASKDSKLRKDLTDPYYLCSANHGFSEKQRDVKGAVYDEDFDAWVGPFIMAAINTKIVHRSNELSGKVYGENFRYDEVMKIGKGFSARLGASLTGIGTGIATIMIALAPTRALIEKIVPKPGEGPSPEQQENGFFDLRFIGKTPSKKYIQVKVTGDKDPGYGSTAKQLAQAGLCLAQDISKESLAGGFWTPATSMGDALIKRLEEQAGLGFEVIDASN
jgi:short subunit dehydrogenase-like uncharacterized protein